MNKMSSNEFPAAGRAVVALGGNMPFGALQGPDLLSAALERLGVAGLPVLAVSCFHATAAWPDPSDPPFTNGVAVLNAAARSAQDVLAVLLSIELEFGRERSRRNAPRTLDLDLLDFDGLVLDEPDLTLPHPRLSGRRFVLAPLAEIWPDWRHPCSGRTAAQLLADLDA